MKRMKKIFAMLLAFTMVLGMTMTASAAATQTTTTIGVTGKETDRGTITVSGVTAEDGLSVKAYKIVEANYENSDSFSGYSPVYDGTVTVAENGDITVTDAQLTAILANITDSTKSWTMTPNTDKTAYSAEVPVGSYLVQITGSEAKIYSNVVVSARYVHSSGQTGVESNNVAIENGNAWIKVQNHPEIDKNIVKTDNSEVKGNTAKIGDTVKYEIEADIPYYGGAYPTYSINDKLTGLTYKEGLTVKVVREGKTDVTLAEGTHYTVTPNPLETTTTEFTLNFVVDATDDDVNNAVYTLNDYAGGKVVVTYNATVANTAAMDEAGNLNTATLNYTKDSKVEGNDGTDSVTTYTYTFEIDFIYKVGQSEANVNESAALAGAKFQLYTDETCGEDKKYSNAKWNGEVTSASDGLLKMEGLDVGTYYLKEVEAPSGYTINNTVYKIDITAVVDSASTATGKLQSWTITVTDNVTKEVVATNTYTVSEVTDETTGEVIFTATPGTATVNIPNTKIIALPSTGGIGTTIFTVAGCGIMIAAAFFFFASRKKEN